MALTQKNEKPFSFYDRDRENQKSKRYLFLNFSLKANNSLIGLLIFLEPPKKPLWERSAYVFRANKVPRNVTE